ncbi:SapC family protein [Gilvimarinus algae]|uniref:SapC family protein n=1 Tax=Gilvimarinus algae TaxID=3058037 RepID=A0ABT8TAE6_9GAMM|nr:SapC family protein [Gilvimarinus sp. SDUM040014]MDO3380916.1 SapC family protein [Gilvimarinus sp. SDUM040014]
MSKIESLNNIDHENLKVNPGYSAELGDDVSSTVTFITEFSEVQKEYPILCRKDPDSGNYQAVVLFGLQKDENLYLSEVDPTRQKHHGWCAEYVPAALARGPFFIGVKRDSYNVKEDPRPVVQIDLAHPKARCDDGRILFQKNGGHSSYLIYITAVLNTINDGVSLTKSMFEAFNRYDLLEAVTIDVELLNKDRIKIKGFETVSTERLSNLSGDVLEELNKSGFLQAAYFMATSMSNVKKLIGWKNRKNSEGVK